MNQETKICQRCKKEFTIEPQDFAFYEKMKVEPPKICYECRIKQRLAFWPFGKFQKRKCDLTGENIISLFPAQARFPVYKASNWFSDNWTPPFLEIDFSKNFFEQLKELQEKTPRSHQLGVENTDCDYCDDVWWSKNCYLCRSLGYGENLSYCYRTVNCRDSLDLTYCFDSEESYDCVYCSKVFKVKYALNTRDSLESAFLYDCRNVNHCFMCWNLRNKEYHIKNKAYSKEEYLQEMKKYRLNSYKEVERLKKEFNELVRKEAIHKENQNIKIINSEWDYLTECKNCHQSCFAEKSEDCSYIMRAFDNKDVFDSVGPFKCQLCYNSAQFTDCYNLKHSVYSTNCRDSEYLDNCLDCENCFGCVSLKKKRFCILNKQYPKKEYEALVIKIKEKMKKDGIIDNFFPYSMAYIGFNLSLANIYFPETKEKIEELGGYWEELEKTETNDLQISQFIDDIEDVGEGILKKAFICEKTGQPFNIANREFNFLKKNSIPLPRQYPDVRNIERLKKMFSFKETKKHCIFCNKEIISHYPPELGYEKFACEDCYQREII